jgi:hypothetical protein
VIQRTVEFDGSGETGGGRNQYRVYVKGAVTVVANLIHGVILHDTANPLEERFDFPEAAIYP